MAFLQLITDTADLEKMLFERPSAFALLTLIAKRAKRSTGEQSDLNLCEAMIGDFQAYGKKNTRQSYREDVKYLQKEGYITIRTTKKGTIAKIINQNLFNINPEVQGEKNEQNYNQQNNHQNSKSATIKTTINQRDKNQTKKTASCVSNNHQNNQQETENTTISATTNNKLSRNILTAENAADADSKSLASVAEYLNHRCTPKGDEPERKIYYDWQAKAERFAQALRIDIEASFTKPGGKRYPIAPSWFRIFKNSDKNKNGKAGNIEKAYAFFYDEPNWDNFTNEQKFMMFSLAYHNGVDNFKSKNFYNQIEC